MLREGDPVMKRELGQFGSSFQCRRAVAALFCAFLAQGLPGFGAARAAETAFVATPVGPPVVVFDPKRDACDGHDVADVPLRAWRGNDGLIHAFALHYENRRLSGKSLLGLKIECPVVFRGNGDGDPKKFDDRIWIAATWTDDGKTIHALAHHEFQANYHKGRCRFDDYMKCWWNSILNIRSENGGRHFRRVEPLVMAATPFPSEYDQGRHRGFFNPSNIFMKEGAYYTLVSTTGWNGVPGLYTGQGAGVCLFRTRDIASGIWNSGESEHSRARFPGPYAKDSPKFQSCSPFSPFPAPVGAVVRHRPSGKFLAIYQAAAGAADGYGGKLTQSGFYLSWSDDLTAWNAPTLVLPTKSYYDDACGAGTIRNYPVLIDESAEGLNFDNIGDEALLFFAETRVEGCQHTSDRKLIARKVRISTFMRQ